jgi:hypothetical protein
MKKLFLFICFLLFIVSLKAQTILSDFGGYGNIASVTGSGPTFTISVSGFMGNPRFQADGSWNGSDVSIGDVIWTDCARFVITGVTSTSFSTMTVTAEVPAGDWTLGVSVPVVTARCAVVSESFGLPILPPPADGNAGALSGIDGNLYACMQNHYNQSLLTQSNPLNEITDFIGTYDVAPAVPASGETGETWRNSVGELYYSDGTSWYTNKEIRFAIASLEGQSAGRYKIGIDTVGVDTIYISNNGTFRQFLSKVNLDQAYNNFGSTPAIITIDGNEGQGDLVLNLTDTEKFTVQDNGNTKFQVNGDGKVGIGGSANNNGTNSNTVQITGTVAFGTLTTAASPVTTLDQSFGSIVYLTANSVQSVQLPALTAAENGRVTTFVNKTRFKKTFTQFYMGMDSVLIDTMPPYSVLDIQTISASHKALRLVNYIDDAGNYTNQRNNAINVGGTATETNTYLNMGDISNSRSFIIGKSFYQPFSIDRNKEQYGLSIAPNSSYPISLFKTGNKRASLYQLFDNQVSSAASVDSVLRNYGYEYNETYFKLDPYNGPSSTNPVFNLISSKFIYGYSGTNMSGIKNPDISASRHLTNVPTFIFSQRGSAYGSKQTSAFSVNSAEYVNSGGSLAGEDASAMLGISTDPSSIDSVSYLMGIYDHINGDIPAINNFQLSSNRNGRAMVVRQKNQPTLSVNLREYDWLSVDFDNDTLGNEVGFYNRSYRLPNAKPSFTLGVKQQLVWTGTGSDATPAFETVTSGGGSGSIDSVRVISNNSGIAVKVNTTSSPATEVTLNAIEQGGATTNQVLKWDGSSWTPNADNSGTGIDTLPDYTTLRSYAGSANMIYLTRSKNKGLFVRSVSGTDNGGTIIVASNGVKWSRIIYNSIYRPEWWNESPTDTVYTDEINQANLLASANKGTVLFELNYAVDSLYNYFGQGYCIEAKSNVIYDVRGSIYLKSNAITAGRKLAVFVGWPGSHDIKFTGSGAIHMNTANNPNGVFGQETGQGIEVYGDTTTPTRNYTIEHLRFTGTFGNPINFKGGAPQTYAAPKHKDIYIHDVKYENFGEGVQIADAQNVYVTNCTGLTNSDYTFGDCFEFVRVKNGKIDGCYFRACCGGSGVDLFSAQETTVSNCTIIGGSNGIDIQPDRFVVPAFTHSKNIIISNVTHDGQGESGQGINMSNNANTKLSNVFISDCYLTNSLVGIAIGPQADTMPGPVVINNTFVEKCQKGILANYVKDLSIQGGRIKKCSTYGIALERNYISGLGLYGVINISGTVVDSNNVGLYANVVSDVGFGGGISLDLRESNTNMITWAEAVKNSPVSFKNERSIIKRTTPGSLSNYSGVQTLRMTGSTGIAGFVGYFHGERLTVTGTNTGTCSLGFFPTDPGGLNLMNRNTFTPDSMLFVTFEYDKWNNRWNEVSRAKDYVGTLATGAIPFIETTGQKKYDAPNLYWNDNKKLGIGTNAPASLPGWSGSAIHIYDAAGLPSLNLSSGANANVGIALEGSTRGNLWSNNGLDLSFSRSGSASPFRIRSSYTGVATTLFQISPTDNIPTWYSTSAYKLPSGTDAQRPAGSSGFIRHNTTTSQFEVVRSGTTWENIISSPISDTHTTNDVLTWNGTGWVSTAPTSGTTDLTWSGSGPYTLNSSSGTDVTVTAGTGISLSGTSSNLTITNTVTEKSMREESFTATAGQTNFTIAYSAPTVSGTSVPVRVYRNGVRLFWVASAPTSTQFTYSGTTITTSANTVGDYITIEYLN